MYACSRRRCTHGWMENFRRRACGRVIRLETSSFGRTSTSKSSDDVGHIRLRISRRRSWTRCHRQRPRSSRLGGGENSSSRQWRLWAVRLRCWLSAQQSRLLWSRSRANKPYRKSRSYTADPPGGRPFAHGPCIRLPGACPEGKCHRPNGLRSCSRSLSASEWIPTRSALDWR